MEFEGDIDYPKKVSEFINNLPAGSKILIKRHPRDDSVYKFENKNVFYAPKDVPGQFLFSLYKDSVFVFTNYSTVELSMPKNCKKEVVLSTYNQKVWFLLNFRLKNAILVVERYILEDIVRG